MSEEESITCQIERVNYRIKMAELLAHWWIARAVTGEAKNRVISVGIGRHSREMTDDEKIKDALDIADAHIHNIEELTEVKIKLLKKLTREPAGD